MDSRNDSEVKENFCFQWFILVFMKDSFVLNCRLFLKRGSGVCLENATMIQIQNMFENGKPDMHCPENGQDN